MHLLLGISDFIEDAIFHRDVGIKRGAACRARVREINGLVETNQMPFDEGRRLAMQQLRIALKSFPPEPYPPVVEERRHA